MKKYLTARIRSFGYAIQGIITLLRTQSHARLHLLASFLVLGGSIYLQLQCWEWVSILLCIGFVWMAEALNTSIEFLADEVTLERRERIRHAKDVAAGAVLISALTASTVAFLVLANHLSLTR